MCLFTRRMTRDNSARVGIPCEKRGSCQITQVFGFLLPHGHEERAASDESVHWERQTSEAIIYYVTYIPLNVQVQMHSITNHYRNDFSKTTQSFYWTNHCEHCRMKQGDFELFEEFDTPFCPINQEDASRILLR